MSRNNLKEKTLSGLFWNFSEQVGLRIIQFLPTVILARLLTPEQFGLIGMLSIFMAFAQVFLDSGFGLALIQKKDVSYADECSIFYFNILVGFVAVMVFFVTAPLVAAFYNQPMLTGLMRWLSLSILIQAFSLIQTTLLTRELAFKTLIKANLFASFCAGVIGIGAAYLGFGVWSLVIQNTANTTLRVLALWLLSNWRPAAIFSLSALWSMSGFGSRMLYTRLVETLFENLYPVFIGKFFSVQSLGYYIRANSLKSAIIDGTSGTLGRVLFPTLATIQDESARLKRAYRQSILLATFFHFPLMIGLIVVARPLIILLFSAQWLEAVIMFQLLCAWGALFPLQVINLEVLKVKGRSDLFFQLTLVKRSLNVVIILITYRWGINAMLVGQIVNGLISYALNSLYSQRLIAYSMKAQVLDFFPNLAASCLMGVGMLVIERCIPRAGDFTLLFVQTLSGAAIYLFVQWLSKSDAFTAAIDLTRQYLPLKANRDD